MPIVPTVPPGLTSKRLFGHRPEDRTANTLELQTFTITSTVKLEATDARAAILKASQLLAEVTHGTLYEFEEFSVKVETP